jgi:hypothetical protein
MLTLTNREAKLATKHSGDAKEVDGNELRTLTVELQEVMLDDTELNALLGEPHAHRSLYNTARDGSVSPFLRCFKALELEKPIDGAFVKLEFDGREITFTSCKLSKIRLELREGGDTALTCKVTAEPVLDASLAPLIQRCGHTVFVELRGEPPTAQQDLPLNRHGADEQPEQGARKRGRRGNGQARAH